MDICKTNSEIRGFVNKQKKSGKLVALVPTMGALHKGHLSLVDEARKQAQTVVMSIFLNALQFNSRDDFLRYPRDLEKDLSLAAGAGVDAVFCPAEYEIYGTSSSMSCRISAGSNSKGLCGEKRPGHFDGVVNVVGILFNIVEPDLAVFGEKDFQQVKVIEELVRDLHFNVKIVSSALIRDSDGLALSSRNELLTADERYQALYISKSLFKARDMVEAGERRVDILINQTLENLDKSGGLSVEYVELRDSKTLAPVVGQLTSGVQMLIAAYVGKVRLIDNIFLGI